MDPHLMDDTADVVPKSNATIMGEEQHVALLKPSARAAIPSAIGWVTFAVAVTAFVVYALIQRPDLVQPATRIWMLIGVVWGVCLLPVFYKLLVLKTTSYSLSTQRLEFTRGILHRRRDQLELVRIRDLTADRTLMDRMLGIGTVILDTVDRTHPVFRIEAQPNVYGVSDWLHRLNIFERQRLGYREFEGTQGL